MSSARVLKVCVWQAKDQTWGAIVGSFFYLANGKGSLVSEWFTTTNWATPEEALEYFYERHPERKTLSVAHYPYVDDEAQHFLVRGTEKLQGLPDSYVSNQEHKTVDFQFPETVEVFKLRDNASLLGWNAADQEGSMDVQLWNSLSEALLLNMMEDSHPGGQRLWSLIAETVLRPAANYAKKEDFWALGLIKTMDSMPDLSVTAVGADGKLSNLYRLFQKRANLNQTYGSLKQEDKNPMEGFLWGCLTPCMTELGLRTPEHQAALRQELLDVVEEFHSFLVRDVEMAFAESDAAALDILNRLKAL